MARLLSPNGWGWKLLVLVLGTLLVAPWGFRAPAAAHMPLEWRSPAGKAEHAIAGGVRAEAQDAVLRVASFNIHRGRGVTGETNIAAIGELLKAVDFAGLYEVDQGWQTDQALELGEQIGLYNMMVATERQWGFTTYGNGLLSRSPVNVVRVPLPGRKWKAYRCGLLSRLTVHGREINVLTVHVDSGSDRGTQLPVILDLFNALAAPAILMGDLNTTATDPVLKAFLDRRDIVNPLAADPNRIDWILAKGLVCRDAASINNQASDHPIVRATFELP
jgi:endonuclease/exonuclease/phosphatase family metal-dependent hydrolase